MNPKTPNLIKITSIILITAALGLELWNVYLSFNNEVLPAKFDPVLWIGTVALVAHSVEGLIAGFNASSRNKNPLTYGIYTFFVGFVALQELFNQSSEI